MLNLFFKLVFCTFFLGFIEFAYAEGNPTANKQFVVVLDAGHGGHDSGNRGGGYFEKNIALDIVLKTGQILEKTPGIKVIYTRKTDVFIPLNKRADIANTAKADLFVSVHCNAHNSKAYGTETFVLGLHANERNFNVAKKENSVILLEDDYETNYDGFDPNSAESIIGLTLMQEEYLEQSLDLASKIQANFTNQLKRFNRGVKQAGFLVLHRTFMPSVLVETGFLTNKNEGKFLNSSNGKQSIASAISKAVIKYKNDIHTMFEVKEGERAMEASFVENKNPEQETKQTVQTTEKVETKSDTLASKEKLTDQIVFKVQILSASTKVDLSPTNFKGLQGVSFMKRDGVFKYYYGNESTYESAKLKKETVKKSGYKSCFIVAFKNEDPIPLSKAIN